MKQIILGTAGHIDHGKTSLIKAITGTNTDRLKEEQKRGITIELGFAPLDLPSGRRFGVVDVPGHEGLVRTMVAGATGSKRPESVGQTWTARSPSAPSARTSTCACASTPIETWGGVTTSTFMRERGSASTTSAPIVSIRPPA